MRRAVRGSGEPKLRLADRRPDGGASSPAAGASPAVVSVPPMPPDAVAQIGVIGGSGLYSLLADADQVEVHTPYGEPSGPVAVGTVTIADGTPRRIAFVARHGAGHRLPPHMINYRANVWA